MELFIDTETTGFTKSKSEYDDPGQPDVVQVGMILSTADRIYLELGCVMESHKESHSGALAIHGITKEDCEAFGISVSRMSGLLSHVFSLANTVVAHNYDFDRIPFARLTGIKHQLADVFFGIDSLCTMKTTTALLKLPSKRGGYKWPKLTELYQFLFKEDFEGAHDALADVRATRRCFYKLVEMGYYQKGTTDEQKTE